MKASQAGLGQPSVTSSIIIQITYSSQIQAQQPTDDPLPELDLIRREALHEGTKSIDAAAAASSTYEELAIAPEPTPSQSGSFGSGSSSSSSSSSNNEGSGNDVFADPGAAPAPEKSITRFPSAATNTALPSGTTIIEPSKSSTLPMGAIIGVTVAAGIALFAVLIAGCVIWQRGRRQKRTRRAMMEQKQRMYDFVPGQAAPMRPTQGPMYEMGRKPLTKLEIERSPYSPGLAAGACPSPALSVASLASRELPPLPVERGGGDKWGPSYRAY